jgi:hypothetical protein
MTEDEARDLLADFDSFDRLENWLAGEPWQATADGWTVLTAPGGWHFGLRLVPGGLQINAAAPGGWKPTVWLVKE